MIRKWLSTILGKPNISKPCQSKKQFSNARNDTKLMIEKYIRTKLAQRGKVSPGNWKLLVSLSSFDYGFLFRISISSFHFELWFGVSISMSKFDLEFSFWASFVLMYIHMYWPFGSKIIFPKYIKWPTKYSILSFDVCRDVPFPGYRD